MTPASAIITVGMTSPLSAVVDLAGLDGSQWGCVGLLSGVLTVAGALLNLQWRAQRRQARAHAEEMARTSAAHAAEIAALHAEIDRLAARVEAGERRQTELEQALAAANVPLPPRH